MEGKGWEDWGERRVGGGGGRGERVESDGCGVVRGETGVSRVGSRKVGGGAWQRQSEGARCKECGREVAGDGGVGVEDRQGDEKV